MSDNYNSVKIRNLTLLFFVVGLISVFPVVTDVYALEETTQQEAEENKEKIISTLQSGISLIKYEIQRDKEIISGKILIPGFRELRQTLKNDIGPKKQLINNLQLLLSKELTGEIGALQRTLEAENEIIQGKQTSKRERRVSKNTIEELIPVKEQVLVSFENFLSGVQ